MKKIFAILLCAVLLASVPVSLFAQDTAGDTDPYAFDEEYYSKFKGQGIKLYAFVSESRMNAYAHLQGRAASRIFWSVNAVRLDNV